MKKKGIWYRQALECCNVMANACIHEMTHRIPLAMLTEQRPRLGKLPDRASLSPYPHGKRRVSRDCLVSW